MEADKCDINVNNNKMFLIIITTPQPYSRPLWNSFTFGFLGKITKEMLLVINIIKISIYSVAKYAKSKLSGFLRCTY